MRESTTQVAERARKVLDIIFQKDIDAQCKNSTSKNKIKIRLTFLFSFFLEQLSPSQLMKDSYMEF